MSICAWCQKNEVEFELAIYHLKRETELVANKLNKSEQLLRNGMYLKVQLCEKCLPATATTDFLRTKLRGREIKQSQTNQK